MSYELKIDPKQRAAGRFIGSVRKALISAALNEKEKNGITQQEIANRLGVNRSVINRLLRGQGNLTLRTVAEIASVLGYVPKLVLERRPEIEGSNHDGKIAGQQPFGGPDVNKSNDNYVHQGQVVSKASSSRMNTLEQTL